MVLALLLLPFFYSIAVALALLSWKKGRYQEVLVLCSDPYDGLRRRPAAVLMLNIWALMDFNLMR
jgi:hypothetical protein